MVLQERVVESVTSSVLIGMVQDFISNAVQFTHPFTETDSDDRFPYKGAGGFFCEVASLMLVHFVPEKYRAPSDLFRYISSNTNSISLASLFGEVKFISMTAILSSDCLNINAVFCLFFCRVYLKICIQQQFERKTLQLSKQT